MLIHPRVSQKSDIHKIKTYVYLFILPAVNDDWAGTTSVAFIHLPEKQEQETAEKEKRTKNRKKNRLYCTGFMTTSVIATDLVRIRYKYT